jgi:hypothetical protein
LEFDTHEAVALTRLLAAYDQQTKVIEAARVITQAVEADNADHFTHGELYGIVRDVQAALRTTEGEACSDEQTLTKERNY